MSPRQPGVQPPVNGPPMALSARLTGLTRPQTVALVASLFSLFILWLFAPDAAAAMAVNVLWVMFLAAAGWRFLALGLARRPPAPRPPARWPRYTVVAALRHEAAMAPQLIARLAALDYPTARLQGFLVIEEDDLETRAAAEACARPSWLKVLIAPPGEPMTKPRALNVALNHARGEIITVYDAEDAPAPGQLREAAARFAAEAPDLACLQAPLRIRPPADPARRRPFLDRQFAAEYAGLFEVVLPALHRLGLPFPLGGTSNHFRVDVLRRIGGWDPWNVTEDADLGFRLHRMGYRLGVMNAPTWETPPGDLHAWLPQRTRWLKGFMQTWLVHMRAPRGLGWRGFLSLQLTLGLALASAALQAAALAGVTALTISALLFGLAPSLPHPAVMVLMTGAASSWAAAAVGSRRASVPYTPWDMALSPFYWALLSLALAHALWRLIRQPFAWDKTPHIPDAPPGAQEAGRQAA